MNVAIPAEWEQFVQSLVSSGDYGNPAEVVREGLQLLRNRQRLRREVNAGIEQLERGQYTEYGEHSLEQFLTDIEAEQQRLFPEEEKP